MNLFEELAYTRDLTLRCFDLPEQDLARVYAPGKWNIRQVLHHIADAETVLYDRIRRTIAKPRQVIWAFDPDAWADQLNYHALPLEINKSIFQAVRASVIHLAEQHYETSDQKEFVHSETGLRTLKDEFEKIAWHNSHHLNQIQQALSL